MAAACPAAGPPIAAFALGVWRRAGWSLATTALLLAASGWPGAASLRAATHGGRTHARAARRAVQRDLIEPLVRGGPQHAGRADQRATVFLRVLRDALFSGPGSADLLLPASAWASCSRRRRSRLAAHAHGAACGFRRASRRSNATGGAWRVDGDEPSMPWCSPAARRGGPPGPNDARPVVVRHAAALRYEPIVTVYVQAGDTPAEAMLALLAGPQAPAQFVFDRGQLGGPVAARLRDQRRAALGRTPAARPRTGHAAARARRFGLLLAGELRGAAAHHREARHLPLHAGAGAPTCRDRPALVAAGDLSTGPTRPRSKARCAAPLRRWHRCVESASGSIGALSPYKILLG